MLQVSRDRKPKRPSHVRVKYQYSKHLKLVHLGVMKQYFDLYNIFYIIENDR